MDNFHPLPAQFISELESMSNMLVFVDNVINFDQIDVNVHQINSTKTTLSHCAVIIMITSIDTSDKALGFSKN